MTNTKTIFTYVIFAVLGFFVAVNANAYDPQPTDEIIVKRNGKVIGKMTRAEYKVVKIENNEKVIKQRVADKKYRESHNSLVIHAGVGNDGLKTRKTGAGYEITERRKPVFGATYCYTKNKAGICATGMTNKTITLGVKKDF